MKKLMSITVYGYSHTWNFLFYGDPAHIQEWAADGLTVDIVEKHDTAVGGQPRTDEGMGILPRHIQFQKSLGGSMTDKINDIQKNLIKLLMRSPKDAEGWAKVSQTLWASVAEWAVPELIELEKQESGGRARFTEEGCKIRDAILWGLS